MRLNLTLKKQWYDMIRSGDKLEEYREIKPYWITRLVFSGFYMHPMNGCVEVKDGMWHPVKDFDFVMFRNGYAKDAPYMLREIESIEVGEGRTEWGAEEGKKYFVIKLKQA